MKKQENKFGLVGKNISYSFSRGYFSAKFNQLKLTNYSYENFDLQDISEFADLVKNPNLKGLNVTIPYKEAIIPFLDRLDETAQKIGAVNTIRFTTEGLVGHNTDAFGFQESIKSLLEVHHKKALVLGTGGASKAIAYVFESLGIDYRYVSRSGKNNGLSYNKVDENILTDHKIIVNCTPLGTHPNTEQKPELPYQKLNSDHLLYDLIYNPEMTAFLLEGEKRSCTTKNGLEMLQLQAEKSWEIWNS